MADEIGNVSDSDLIYFAQRPSVEYDEVVLQADYAARAAISFYRFRQLGGGRSPLKRRGRPDETGAEDGERGLRFGKTTGQGIHYVSDHPQVRLLNLSIIALLILFESAANAYFFAQQSEFGISGGLFQAAAVSLANVATSYFIIGFWGLRHVSVPWSWDWPHRWTRLHFIRVFGAFAILFGLVMVLLVNLSAAHYRNILDLRAEGLASPTEFVTTFPRFPINREVCEAILTSDIGQSIGSAATNAMCRPFALHSLDAMVLFALGLAISALATFEGRRADSAFPGFSDAARQIERSRRDLQDALDEYYDSYEDVFEDAKTTLGRDLTARQKITISHALDERVAAFRELLTSDPYVLRDEFDVPAEVVEKITGKPMGTHMSGREPN